MVKIMVERLYLLLVCHAIGDYVLQSSFLADTKGSNPWHLIIHCILYSVPFYICYGLNVELGILIVTHFIIDALKARYKKLNYVQDQLLHIVIMIFLYVFCRN